MAIPVQMPELGMSMTSGKVVRWHKENAAAVKKGDLVAEIETEKIAYELEAPAEGIFHAVAEPGVEVPVGEVIAYLLSPGEALPAPAPKVAGGEVSTVPVAGRAVEVASPSQSGPTTSEIRASPVAKRLAQELKIDLSKVVGTGPGGRILEEDVRRAAPSMPLARERSRLEALSPIRQTIATRMRESLQQMAQLTFTCEVDMAAVREGRRRLLAAPRGERVSYTSIFLKITADALTRYPALNARIVGDTVELFQKFNIGFAVAVEGGVMVPVVKRANEKDLQPDAQEVEDLTRRAKQGGLTASDVADGTFTISVLGVVDTFTPIINPPQTGILGFGRIAERPVAYQGQLALRPTVILSLTVDHRLIDGEMAANFLRRVNQLMEHPTDLFL